MSQSLKIQLGTILLVIALWEALGHSGLILRAVFPPFSEVLVQLVSLLSSVAVWQHISVSAYEIVWGFVIGGALGLLVGAPLGTNDYLYRLFDPLFYYLGAIPKIILLPVFILFLGVGVESKMGLAAISAFFPIAVNTALAVRGVEPILVRSARALGAGRWQIYTKVYLPSTFGSILSGLRLGLGVAITGALLAETSVAQAGLGFRAIELYSQLRIAEMYALILLIFVFALLLNTGITRLIQRATRHQRSGEEAPFS